MEGGAGAFLPRRALEQRLDGALAHRLTTLTAAEGYGKSTLLERWGAEVGAALHRVSAEDRNVVHLVARVAATLRLRATALSATELPGVLSAPLGPDGTTETASRATALGGRLGEILHETLRRHLVLVLDDVDVLPPSEPSALFLDALVRSAPHRLHIVAASRVAPPFPVARLRARREILELTAADLALDPEEVQLWLRESLGADAEELAPALLRRTGGWPAAIASLLRELASTPAGQRAALLDAPGRAPAISGLVLRELRLQPAAARQLVQFGTVVPVLNVELADHLGAHGEVLSSLHRTGPFLETHASLPGGFRLTATAREAVEEHAPLVDEEVQRVVASAARWYLEHDALDLALRTLVAAGSTPILTGLLEEQPGRFESPAVARDLLLALDALPDEVTRRPLLRRLAGIAHQSRGDWASAHTLLTGVMETPAFDAAVAWRLGLIQHLRGDLDAALRTYEWGAKSDGPAPDAAICAAWAASVHWLRGQRDACAELADEALARAVALDDPRALAAAHMVLAMLAALDGDRRANDAHYLRAAEHAEQAGDVLQLIRIRSNRASHHLEEGAYEDALAELEVAGRLADLTGFTPFGALTLSNRAEALVALGRLEEAAIDAADAVAAWRSLGSSLAVYGLQQQAQVQRLRGDTSAAIATYREAIAAAETAEDVQGLVPCLAQLAEILVTDDPEEAAGLAARASAAAGAGMGVALANLAAAHVAIAGHQPATARRHLEVARAAATERRDRPALARVVELEAVLAGRLDLAEEAVSRWVEVGDRVGIARAELVRAELGDATAGADVATAIETRLHDIGCHELDGRIAALRRRAGDDEAVPAVSIQTLGRFRVLRGGVPVPHQAWQSRKARQLVKLLAARRGRPTPREWLVEQLWPEAQTSVGLKRLNVMVSTVRGVLDPDRERDSGHFLVSEHHTLQLHPHHTVLDVVRFLDLAEAADAFDRGGDHAAALRQWRAAEGAYTGEFCEEEAYAAWAVGMREEARTVYAQVVAHLADADLRAGRHDETIRLWLRLLERDPYDERTHLELVGALLAAGRPGDARRRYLTYVARMRELGVEPSPFPATASLAPEPDLNPTVRPSER